MTFGQTDPQYLPQQLAQGCTASEGWDQYSNPLWILSPFLSKESSMASNTQWSQNMMIKLVVSVLLGGNKDVLVGFSRKQSLRQESPHALLLLYWRAEVRPGGGRTRMWPS